MKKFILISLICLLAFSTTLAGTTGKLSGKVTDKDSGSPLVGVNIFLVGTNIGTASDQNGNFIIINIPPGVYTVKATMIGYSTQVIQDVKITVDLTTNLNIQLSISPIKGEEVTVVAERPMIRADITASQAAVSGSEIEEMPVEEFEDVMRLQAGVVTGAGGEIHIRGGRSNEIVYMIDGISVTDPYFNTMGVEIENNAIQELQLVSGTFNAEYGQAMSGVVNIITREGNYQNYALNITSYIGDYYTTDTKTFHLGNQFNPVNMKDIRASFNGPLLFLKNKASFFLSGRYNYYGGYLWGKRLFYRDSFVLDSTHTEWMLGQHKISELPDSVFKLLQTDPLRFWELHKNEKEEWNLADGKDIMMNPSKQLSLQGKISLRLTHNIKLNLSGQGSNTWSRGYSHRFRFNPDGRLNYYSRNANFIFSWNHTLSSRTFYTLKYSFIRNHYEQYLSKDPEDSTVYNTDPRIFSLNLFSGNYYILGGMSMNHYYRTSRVYTIKFDFSSQITPVHLIKTGLEFKKTLVDMLSFNIQLNEDTDWKPVVPKYDPNDPSTEIYRSTTNYDKARYNPYEWAFYIQDKMEFTNLIVNLGIRYEYFYSNGKLLVDPRDPNPYSPIKPGNKFWDYNGNGFQDPGEPYKTDEERLSSWFKKPTAKTQVSPRIGIAYPITDRGVIHFSYGHFLQMPPLTYLFRNPDFEVLPGYQTTIGNADLEPQRTVQYEIGLQQQLTDDIAIDVTGFYKDVRNLTSTEVIETYEAGKFYARYINYDYGNTKGITFSLEKRRTGLIYASIDYTFSIAEGNASDPNQTFWDAQSGVEPQKQLIYLDWDQRHTLNATISLIEPRNWGLSFIFSYGSGLPYSPTEPFSGTPSVFKNSGRRPPTYNLDMRANKKFQLGKANLALLLNIYNLFDIKNVRYVYSSTGRADYTLAPNSENSARDYWNRPNYYYPPRLIKLGIQIDI